METLIYAGNLSKKYETTIFNHFTLPENAANPGGNVRLNESNFVRARHIVHRSFDDTNENSSELVQTGWYALVLK